MFLPACSCFYSQGCFCKYRHFFICNRQNGGLFAWKNHIFLKNAFSCEVHLRNECGLKNFLLFCRRQREGMNDAKGTSLVRQAAQAGRLAGKAVRIRLRRFRVLAGGGDLLLQNGNASFHNEAFPHRTYRDEKTINRIWRSVCLFRRFCLVTGILLFFICAKIGPYPKYSKFSEKYFFQSSGFNTIFPLPSEMTRRL